MSLSLALNNALSGLNINQRQLSVLSQNIANANTAGYSRQVLNQTAVYTNGIGNGVQAAGVARKIDEYLQRAVQNQSANVGASATMSDYYSRMQILLGRPGSGNGIDSYVTNFFNSLQSLSQTPDLVSRQQSAVSSGAALAGQFSSLAGETQNLRYQADVDIGHGVAYVNQQIQDLHIVNLSLNRASTLGNDTAGLLDQRDALIRNISQYVDINTSFRNTGEVSISTGNGVALLDQSAYRIDYSPVPSGDALTSGSPLSAMRVYRQDPNGNDIGNPAILVSGGSQDQIASTLRGGKLKALVELRDRTLPGVLDQLDAMAAVVRDQVNAIHNQGSGWPAPQALTGTRAVAARDTSDWTGSVQIALLQANGKPIPSAYLGETAGAAPLTIDLGLLNDGSNNGRVSVQTIINEINQGFAVGNKAQVGNLSNIRLASNSANLPGVPPQFNFDFDLENLSGLDANFFVSGVTVLDDGGNPLSGATMNVPSVALAGSNTFVTHSGAQDDIITVNTASPHGLVEGQRIYLNDPGVSPNINGIASSAVQGYFIVTNVTSTGFDIQIPGQHATSASGVAASGQKLLTAYDKSMPGTTERTRDKGSITANLAGNTSSQYYDIRVNVAVEDGQGGFTTSTVTYRINNGEQSLLNHRYAATAVGAGGTLVQPASNQPYARAMLVDATGKELPKVNGQYVDGAGYLKIETTNGSYSVALNELNSKQLGSPAEGVAGTNRGFSHYFELNNFFASNGTTATGDVQKNSAINMKVQQRILDNPSLISLGSLVQSAQPADSLAKPVYTFERHSGDNQVMGRIAALASQNFTFAAAAGLPATQSTLDGYAAQFLGFNASQAASAENALRSGETLLAGFEDRSQAVSGVNIDEELANTIIYQNAYTASARVISVTKDLYDSLLSAI